MDEVCTTPAADTPEGTLFPQLMTVVEAADYLGLTKWTVYGLCKSGKIPAAYVPRSDGKRTILIHPRDVAHYKHDRAPLDMKSLILARALADDLGLSPEQLAERVGVDDLDNATQADRWKLAQAIACAMTEARQAAAPR